MTALDDLVDLLDLEQIEINIFRGRSPESSVQRVFGGQVAGQALVAAGRTVGADRQLHSLHAYFLRPGDPSVPIVYTVDRIRDGAPFTTRRVVAVQHGRAIFGLSASFAVPESWLEHAEEMPAAPPPETLRAFEQRLAEYPGELPRAFLRPRPIDVRYIDDPPWVARADAQDRAPRSAVWMRASGRLPDEPLLHVCVVAYASDLTLLDSVLRSHGLFWDASTVWGASLDHAMWFHRPFRADEWFLYDQGSPVATGGRGLAYGRIFTADGSYAASVIQEGLLRPGTGSQPS